MYWWVNHVNFFGNSICKRNVAGCLFLDFGLIYCGIKFYQVFFFIFILIRKIIQGPSGHLNQNISTSIRRERDQVI